MRFSLFSRSLILLASGLLTATLGRAVERPPQVVEPAEPAPPPAPALPGIDLLHPTGAWRQLLPELEKPRVIRVSFVERRFSELRREPLELTGTIRLSPQHGLSIGYETPKTVTLIADGTGMLERRADGSERAIPHDPRAEFFNRALLGILQFDTRYLAENFHVYGQGTPDAWEMRFVPKDPSYARVLSSVDATGTGNLVKTIVVHRGLRQRIEITLTNAQLDTTFGPEEIAHYFR